MDEIRFVAPQMSATRCALTKSTMSADQSADSVPRTDLIRLFLCGDVMTGRGIDQVLPHPSDPGLHEPCIRDARFYLKLAESVNGAITRPVTADYIWGDALGGTAICLPSGTLDTAGIAHTGASGVPREFAATAHRPGVNFLEDISKKTARRIAREMHGFNSQRDVIVASIHWGGNWDYHIRAEEIRFVHQLIDQGIAVVHGHSSHHVKTAEIYSGRLVLYGCGDLMNDYEGISGYEEFRSDLTLLYLPAIDPRRGQLVEAEAGADACCAPAAESRCRSGCEVALRVAEPTRHAARYARQLTPELTIALHPFT